MFFPNKTIFVHIPKTGGSSLEYAITAHFLKGTPEDKWDRMAYDQFTLHGFFKKSVWGKGGHPHSFISEYDAYLNLDENLKFVILRNPQEQLISLYNQLRQNNDIPSLEHFVLGNEGMNMSRVDHYIDQYKYTHIEGELRIDKVFVFERYAQVQDFVEKHFEIQFDRNRQLWKTDPSGETLSPKARQYFESVYHQSIELYHKFL